MGPTISHERVDGEPVDRGQDAALAAFLEVPVAVCVLDRDLRFVALNDAMAAANGLPRDAHLGRSAPDLLPDLDPDVWAAIRRVIETGEASTHLVRGRTHASAEVRAWQEEHHAWRDPRTGEIRGVIATAIDVTEQQRVNEAARRRHERLAGLAMLAADLVGVSDQGDVAQILCRHALSIFDATATAVAVGPKGSRVRVLAAIGYGEDERNLDRLANGTALGDTARSGRGHRLVAGPGWDTAFPEGAAFHRDLGLRGTATVPFLSADETIGALAVSFAESPDFTDDDTATLATLASIGSQALERARSADERRRAAALRDAFIDVMAHELKTPLVTIYGGLQTISLHNATLAQGLRDSLLEDATAEAHRLVRLVEDLVVLSRLERGVEIDMNEPLMLSHVARAVIEAKMVTLGATIDMEIPSGIPPVRGERAYVEQVIRNLVTNALKYGDPPFEVVVARGDGEATLRVLDRGPGVPVDPDRLFELYYRDPTAAKRASGSGIGLFVCRQLVNLMGGRIWAANRPDGGAEFGFALRVWDEDDV